MPTALGEPMQDAREPIAESSMLVGRVENAANEDEDGKGGERKRQSTAETGDRETEDGTTMGDGGLRNRRGGPGEIRAIKPQSDECESGENEIAGDV